MNHLEWNNQDTFVLTDIYTPEGYAYALYRTKPEFAILADVTEIAIPIRIYEDYQKYKDEDERAYKNILNLAKTCKVKKENNKELTVPKG